VAVLFGGGGHRNAAGFQLMVIQDGHNVGAV
jgi:oligoribonuclease NrnB/cAMP/cGMP phosphodiesterase (DHH superfamily)